MNVIVSAPPAEPVTVEDARLWVRASSSLEDELLGTLIAAARARAEHLTSRYFVQRAVLVQLEDFSSIERTVQLDKPFGWSASIYGEEWESSSFYGSDVYRMPLARALLPAPILAVTALRYRDPAGVLQTVDPASYVLFAGEDMAIRFALGYVVPSVQLNRPDAVQIEMTVGCPPVGVDPDLDYRANLPPELRQWVRMNIATWYNYRESMVNGKAEELPASVFEGLLDGLILARRFA